MQSLDDQLEIRAYFSKELPPPYNATGRYVRDLLAEYRDASGGKIELRFVEPDTDEEKQAGRARRRAARGGPEAREGQLQVHEGYRGISFHYLGDTKAHRRASTAPTASSTRSRRPSSS